MQPAPSTVKEAFSSETKSGTFAQRFIGTFTTSACFPFEITLSPFLKFFMPEPTL